MELTPAQQQVVDHRDGPLRVRGGAGTGKTTALLHRYLRLARGVGTARVLVVSRNRDAALRFRDAVLAHLAGGVDVLPITTVHGLAFDVLRAQGVERRLLTGAEQWAFVRRLLAAERDHPELWPSLHPLLTRRAFVDEVADAVQRLRASSVGDDQLDDRWRELAAFARRYEAALQEHGATDGAGLVVEACHAAAGGRFDHVLVDDFETATVAAARLLGLVADGASVTVAGNAEVAIGAAHGQSPTHLDRFVAARDIRLDEPFRHRDAESLVLCRHPSIEPEA